MSGIRNSLALILIAGCSGGGGGNDTPVPPVPPVAVTAAFVNAGVVLPLASPAAVNFKVIQTQAELDQVAARLPSGSLPTNVTSPNFTLINLIYLEGPPDRDNSSYVAVTSASRAATGTTTIDWEYCGAGVAGGTRRAFSFYTIAPLPSNAVPNMTTRQTPDCVGRTRLGTTLVASGVATAPLFNDDFQLATTQAEWDAIKTRFPGTTIPPAFVSPDFSQVNLLYVQKADDSVQSSVKVLSVTKIPNPPTNWIVVEYCSGPGTTLPTHRPFSVSAVPVLSGERRVENAFVPLPSCVL